METNLVWAQKFGFFDQKFQVWKSSKLEEEFANFFSVKRPSFWRIFVLKY